mgnify:FL=1
MSYSVTFGPQKDSLDFLDENDDMAVLSGSNWDSMINEFENIVDKYINVLYAYQNGDDFSTDEISDYLDKIDVLSKQLAQANDAELTNTQKDKIITLANKLNNM